MYWRALLSLVQQGELDFDKSKKEVMVFCKIIDGYTSKARLENDPKYEWLTKELVAIKKLLDTMTDEQMQTLKEHLTYKDSEPSDKTEAKPKEATITQVTPAEVLAFRSITALKLKIDHAIINPYDPSAENDALPSAHRIPWGRAFA